MSDIRKYGLTRPHLWLIRAIGVIVPRRLRAGWRQEWEAELRYREELLAEWDNLDWRNNLAHAVPQQGKVVSPIKIVPFGQQFFAVAQLGFPLLPPIGAQAARHDHADECDQPEVGFRQAIFAALKHWVLNSRLPVAERLLSLAVCFSARVASQFVSSVASATVEWIQ